MSRPPEGEYRSVDAVEAERLVRAGAARVLDVRSPAEYEGLGHIPGALLLPVDLIASAPATLPREGPPVLVCCEHGIRSAHAARLLARAGFDGVLNLSGGMSRWRGPRDHAPGDPFVPLGPTSWLVACAGMLPARGRVLDVACGRGRHALLLASAGYEVRALDRDAASLAALREDAARLDLPIETEAIDLEAGPVDLGRDRFDMILVVRFLHRPLFPALAAALRPGGLLLYETFTVDQAARGRPTNPDYLLEHGELDRLVAPLEVLSRRDGEHDGSLVAAVAARKPRASA